MLFGVSFLDTATGTVVGDYGLILHTIDGGATWTKQDSGGAYPFLGVSFTDNSTGTVVGGPGKILRTTNGGAIWSEQTSGVTNFLYGVSFTDANRGTAVGTQGLILRTTNGGSTWSSQSSEISSTRKFWKGFRPKRNATAIACCCKGSAAASPGALHSSRYEARDGLPRAGLAGRRHAEGLRRPA